MAKILGVKIDGLTHAEVMEKITQFLRTPNLKQIVTVNPEFIVEAQKDTHFKEVLNSADLSIPDGFGLQIGAKIAQTKIGERLTGVDLTWELAKFASENNYSIFLLGGTLGVAQKTADRLKFIYPNLKIAGTYAGQPEDQRTLEFLKNHPANILLVAFGAPKQDIFIYDNKQILSARIAIGVGGTFDYISGKINRAPQWLRSLGLEWLYRLIKQPRRIGRIWRAVIVFPFKVLIKRIFA